MQYSLDVARMIANQIDEARKSAGDILADCIRAQRELRARCPHDMVNYRRRVAEDDSYDLCTICGHTEHM